MKLPTAQVYPFLCTSIAKSYDTRKSPPGTSSLSHSTGTAKKKKPRKNETKSRGEDSRVIETFPRILWNTLSYNHLKGATLYLLMFHSNVLIIELSTKGEDPWKWISRQKLNNRQEKTTDIRDDTRFLLFRWLKKGKKLFNFLSWCDVSTALTWTSMKTLH